MAKQHDTLTLGTDPIGRLLTQYAIPAIIAMTASSLYNMADSIFIGQGVGALAISGLALTFPLMKLGCGFWFVSGCGCLYAGGHEVGPEGLCGGKPCAGQRLAVERDLGIALHGRLFALSRSGAALLRG